MDRRNIAAARLSAVRWWFGLTALASAAGVGAQVTPVEPFGGRPFGSDPSAPAPAPPGRAVQQQGAPMVVQPGAAPVLVQPGAGPVMVQPQPQQVQPQPQPQVQAQPQPQPQVQPQSPNTSAMGGRPTSSVNPQPPMQPAQPQQPAQNTNNPNDPDDRQQNGSSPQRAMTSPITPPLAGGRTPAAGAASTAGQPVRGLPPDAPRLVISGAVYSPDPASRMLIVNGNVVREGADLGSGVVLQEVRQDSAVLDFRGNRYNVFF